MTNKSIAESVGNTPLLLLSRLAPESMHKLYAKCEFMNPGGSVKDRIAFYMIEKAEKEGRLRPGQLLVEATGGNTGIGLALVARLKGYKLLCVMAEKVGSEKVKMMQILGAETLVLPGGKTIDDPTHFINQAKQIASDKNAFYVNQFNNPDNLEAHYKFTGPEIWKQTEGKIDLLFAGIGTGGTICGAGRFLKEMNPNLKLVLADPVGSLLAAWKNNESREAGSYIVEGIGNDFIPGIVDLDLIDDAVYVSDQESVRTSYELLNKEALFVGGSSGCIAAAALKYLQNCKDKALCAVAILPGSGRFYTNTFYNRDWLAAKGIDTSFIE